MVKLLWVVVYGAALLVGVTFGCGLWAWVFMEISLACVLVLLANSGGSGLVMFEYFMVQTTSSVLLFLSVMSGSVLGFVLSLALKVGMVPWVGWVYRTVSCLGVCYGLVVIIGVQKVIPLAVVSGLEFDVCALLALFPLVSSLLAMTLYSWGSGLIFGLFSTTLIHSSWLVVLGFYSVNAALVYVLMYSLSLVYMCVSGSPNRNNTFLAMTTLTSLPPMVGLVMKVFSLASGFGGFVFCAPFLILLTFCVLFYFSGVVAGLLRVCEYVDEGVFGVSLAFVLSLVWVSV